MFCANCGNEMSEEERFCSKCGFRKQEAAPAQPVQESVSAAPLQPAQAVGAEPKKKSRMGALIGIAAGVIVLAAAGIMLFTSDRVENWIRKTFQDPAEYYQWVEEKAAKEAASNMAEVYSDYLRENLQIYDMTVNVEAQVELEEAGMDIARAYAEDFDWEWLNSLVFAGNVSVKDNRVSAAVGEKNLFTVEGILDMADEMIYLQAPNLSEMYVRDDVQDTEVLMAYCDMLRLLYENTPDKKAVEGLLNKYDALAISCIEDVTKSDTAISAEGVRQDCVKLEAVMDEKVCEEIMTTVLTEMSEDAELKQWILDAFAALEKSDMDLEDFGLEDIDGEEFYEQLQELVEELADDAENISEYDIEIFMSVYVDSKGNICGRTIEYEDMVLEVLMAHDGSRFGYSASAEMGGDIYAILGSGEESEGLLNGEFEVQYTGIPIVEISVEKLDVNKMQKGKMNGTFTIVPSAALVSALTRAADAELYSSIPARTFYSSLSSIIREISVVIVAEGDASEMKLACSVLWDDEKWGTVTLTASKDRGETVKLPADKLVLEAEDQEDFEEWYDTIDWDSFIKKLKEADAPEELIEAVEEISDMSAEEVWFYF